VLIAMALSILIGGAGLLSLDRLTRPWRDRARWASQARVIVNAVMVYSRRPHRSGHAARRRARSGRAAGGASSWRSSRSGPARAATAHDALTILTLGLFMFVLNRVLPVVTSGHLPGFVVTVPGAAFLGALLISVVSWALTVFVKRIAGGSTG